MYAFLYEQIPLLKIFVCIIIYVYTTAEEY